MPSVFGERGGFGGDLGSSLHLRLLLLGKSSSGMTLRRDLLLNPGLVKV